MNQPLYRVKIARVRPDVKEQRRAIQLLAGGHDFHGSGNLKAVVSTGGLAQGTRNSFGSGVYYTQDKPAWEYWRTTLANGPREGGLVVPRELSQSAPAQLFKPVPGAYRVGPDISLTKGITLVADKTNPAAVEAQRAAQRQFGVRAISLQALEQAAGATRSSAYQKLLQVGKNNPGLGRVLAPVERGLYGIKNLVASRF